MIVVVACSFRTVDAPPGDPSGGNGGGGGSLHVADGGWIDGGPGGAQTGGLGGGTGGTQTGGLGGGTGGTQTGGLGGGTGGTQTGGVGGGTGGTQTGGTGGTGGCTPVFGSTGWKSPLDVSTKSKAGATFSWTNPDAVKASDNAYATVAFAGSALVLSEYLWTRSFGFQLPTNASVDGIEVAIERRLQNNGMSSVSDDAVQLLKAGTLTGQNRSSTWQLNDTYATFGSGTDTWGTTWTAAEINSVNFGLAVALEAFGSTIGVTAYVDHIRIRVHYTQAC